MFLGWLVGWFVGWLVRSFVRSLITLVAISGKVQVLFSRNLAQMLNI